MPYKIYSKLTEQLSPMSWDTEQEACEALWTTWIDFKGTHQHMALIFNTKVVKV